MKRMFRFILGAIIGGILGSVTILLLAPGSGSETRAALVQKINMLRGQIQEAMQEKKAELEEELESLKKN